MRVYCAGPYSAKTLEGNAVEMLGNMRTGIAVSVRVIQAGHACFCPWLDFLFGLVADLKIGDYRRNSLEWVKVSDVMLLLPGWQDSQGCRVEVAEASLHGIPVFELNEFDDMIEFLNKSA